MHAESAKENGARKIVEISRDLQRYESKRCQVDEDKNNAIMAHVYTTTGVLLHDALVLIFACLQ